MAYESSYEIGRQPFLPNTKRGYWANPSDFIYAGISLAFRLDVLTMTWFMQKEFNVPSIIPGYLLSLVIYIVPLMVIQSFMGQFSSSSFISSFRLSPLFKGIGYVTLALNICVLTYYSIFAMIPLIYMFASLQPTLPWSCEGLQKWSHNLTNAEKKNICNMQFENAEEDSQESLSNDTVYDFSFADHHIPSVLYFRHLFNDFRNFSFDDVDFSMSWQLILCAILVWSVIAFIIYKFFNTEKFGQLIRYSLWTLIGLLILFIIRFSFLPGAGSVYHHVFVPQWHKVLYGFTLVPVYGLSSFGPGWGLFIALSSFNKFKTNIMRSSWIIGIGQLFIIMSLNLLTHLSERYYKELNDNIYFSRVEYIWTLYLSSGSVMAHMEFANLWTILFNFMLFLASMTLIIIQLHSVLITIFDEFIILRERKLEVCMGIIGFMAICSLYFTSNHGVTYYAALSVDTLITQNANNLLLILVVLWIYGRVRFQRDIEFMIKERFSTWKIFILRFITPLGMILVLLASIIWAINEHSKANGIVAVYALIFIFIPWLFIPAYAVRDLLQSVGSIKCRFQKCCRPTDWYPVEPEDRQQYEEAFGAEDITHPLNEFTEDVL